MVCLGDYREVRRIEDSVLTAPDHETEGGVLATQTSTYDVYRAAAETLMAATGQPEDFGHGS